MDDRIKRCFGRKGLRIADPSENLAISYLASAEETLSNMRSISSTMWMAVMRYYCEYFAAYALLVRIGVRSSDHECTLAVCALIEREQILPEGTVLRLREEKRARIEAQYYIKNVEMEIDIAALASFLARVKRIVQRISGHEIERLRHLVSQTS